jgi:hypothetical protein
VSALLQEKARDFFVEDKIPEDLGWIAWLSPEHLHLFRSELFAAARANMSEDELMVVVESWQATAELDHSPEAQLELERNRASTRFASVDAWLKKLRTT